MVCFYVINRGKENVILGHPWLEAVNPIINWKKGTITIPPTKDQGLALSFSHLAECASYLSKNTCLATTLTVNPQLETTLDPIEQTGLCWYLSAENLDESFVPKIGKLYPLSIKEQEAADEFINENLHSGKICPSKSPQASLFFFVKKKDGGL